jgi:phosphatidylinositol alpha 1,6-mannosyltransferase
LSVPRVAFFADSFYEVNGVATTSREFARFAQERNYPVFCVHTGPETRHVVDGAFETFEICNSGTVLPLEADMSFDLLFLRHRSRLMTALSRFQPDFIHITGPSHCGFLGLMLSHALGVPLAASWHTNLHEYAARRLSKFVHWLPARSQKHLLSSTERLSLRLILRFYSFARVFFAPNPELVNLLSSKTGRRVHLMTRGIDKDRFSPRLRSRSDSAFVIGYVGRLSPEKNVRLLADLERMLVEQGLTDYKFLIVGHGSERSWLAAQMQRGDLPGVLLGADLARAYADMDVFVFPSTTDTFGNVVLESIASGVPTIVSAEGGPKFLIEDGVTGMVAKDIAEYCRNILTLRNNPALRQQMSKNAAAAAAAFSWPAVFERVYQAYSDAIASGLGPRSTPPPPPNMATCSLVA